jgi:hypothetical protein
MIATFTLLRSLALLRRTTRALESLASSQHTLATIAIERRDRIQQRRTRKPRPTEFGTLDIAEVNKRWHAERAADAEGMGEVGEVGWQEP